MTAYFDPWLMQSQTFAPIYFIFPRYCQFTSYLVPSTWYQILGSRSLVQATGTKYLVPSAWYQAFDDKYSLSSPCYQVLGTKDLPWCQVSGSKYFVRSTWHPILWCQILVPDTWYQMLGTKSLVPGTYVVILGTKYLVELTWYRYLVPSMWYQVLGTRYDVK